MLSQMEAALEATDTQNKELQAACQALQERIAEQEAAAQVWKNNPTTHVPQLRPPRREINLETDAEAP
jgi:hypothetical protein